jgi:hypothetical protein
MSDNANGTTNFDLSLTFNYIRSQLKGVTLERNAKQNAESPIWNAKILLPTAGFNSAVQYGPVPNWLLGCPNSRQ